jgi:hypothetical protein
MEAFQFAVFRLRLWDNEEALKICVADILRHGLDRERLQHKYEKIDKVRHFRAI